MHGRIKVRSTAEQAEIKRKEQEKKSIAFTNGMSQVISNRYNVDAYESNLKITEKLLSGNSDVTTLWNIRKEIFLKMLERDENIDNLFQQELLFLQNCLQANPKSYGVWNQRVFVFKNMVVPNYKEELRLCDLFLKLDERNFHCWDYRRFVVKNSDISSNDEFNFTKRKITDNFSNYSAWHYRSKLLPSLFPDENFPGKVSEEVLVKEFKLAQNAFFTDPNDQSAWFYQRWLLGKEEVSPKILSAVLQRDPSHIVASFSMPISLHGDLFKSLCSINNIEINCKWVTSESLFDNKVSNKYSCVWITEYPMTNNAIHCNVSLPMIKHAPKLIKLFLPNTENIVYQSWNKDELTTASESKMFCDEHTDAKASILKDELEACKMLLKEEPENKWTMLTIVYLMHALDMCKYRNQMLELFVELVKVDPMRSGYFKDLQSKYLMEIEIERIFESKSSIESFDLSSKKLTVFHYPQYFTTSKYLSLGNNQFSCLSFLQLLPCTQKITSIKRGSSSNNEVDKLTSIRNNKVIFKET